MLLVQVCGCSCRRYCPLRYLSVLPATAACSARPHIAFGCGSTRSFCPCTLDVWAASLCAGKPGRLLEKARLRFSRISRVSLLFCSDGERATVFHSHTFAGTSSCLRSSRRPRSCWTCSRCLSARCATPPLRACTSEWSMLLNRIGNNQCNLNTTALSCWTCSRCRSARCATPLLNILLVVQTHVR